MFVDKRKVIEFVADFLNTHNEIIIPLNLKTELINRLRDFPEVETDVSEFDL